MIICGHCHEELGSRIDPRDGHTEYMHASEDGPDAYLYCRCQCVGCTTDSGDYTHCCDGEIAEPAEVLPGPQPIVAILDAEPEANL